MSLGRSGSHQSNVTRFPRHPLTTLPRCPRDGNVSEQAMAIKKQEFYEGAALHVLARSGGIRSVRYEAPFFLLNDRLFVLLKYSTKGRSPWGFTFTQDEQIALGTRATRSSVVIGLICGSDGIAAFSYDSYRTIAAPRKSAVHIACYRQHGKHYDVNGPDGPLDERIAPSVWRQLLHR
jgi:hypothetical protein